METYAFRLAPGQLLREEIQKITDEKNIKAGVILTCVGNLEKAVLRMANADIVKTFEGTFEVVSCVGTLEKGDCHIHKPIEPIGPEEIVYQGKIHEIVQQKMRTGEKEQVFEFARRSPGVRLIILDSSDSLLLTKEYRHEARDFDFRLPGGKVFDRLVDYTECLRLGDDVIVRAKEAGMREAREEVGIEIDECEYYYTSREASATLMYDLIYFVVKKFHRHTDGQCLEHGEDITVTSVPIDEVKAMCLDGRIKEDRSAAVLLRFLLTWTDCTSIRFNSIHVHVI